MQATRGTTLSSTTAASRWLLPGFALTVAGAWGLDQVTKLWAVEELMDHAPIELVPELLSLRFLRNPGAAFGMGASMTVVLSLISLAVVGVVIKLAPKLRDRAWTVALALLLAGALGNLTDRIFRAPEPLHGHVVDFIDYGGWFVGNIADIYLTLAAVIIAVRSLQGVGLDGQREKR